MDRDPNVGAGKVAHGDVRRSLVGSRALEADALVIAPGCIDMHARGQQLPAAWMQAFDGVTTALELESGLLPVSSAYDTIENEGGPISYGMAAAWAFARVQVMQPELPPPDGTLVWFQQAFAKHDWQNSVPSPDQLAEIVALVEGWLNDDAPTEVAHQTCSRPYRIRRNRR